MNAIHHLLGPATLWGIGAAVPAILAEYLYRTIKGPWWHYLWVWTPIQLCIGYCIYRLVTIPNQTIMDSLIVFAFSTMALRIAVTLFVLGDPVKGGTWFAVGLLLMARIAQTCWGR